MTEANLHIVWQDGEGEHRALWRSEAGVPPPKRVVLADDTLDADRAYRLCCEGTALLWQGDFQNARQLLNALARRVDKPKKAPGVEKRRQASELFHLHRMAQAQRARVLGQLLIPLDADYAVPLRRGPDVAVACGEAWGASGGDASVVSLRELQALIGAHEWRKKGVAIPVLGERIHPYYGVFSPIRGEYLDLIAEAPLPAALAKHSRAFDIGTGTGVIAALLARRGVGRVVATDRDARALACARDNLRRLGLARQVEVIDVDLFPSGEAALVVCNPPWVPGKPSSPIEHAVYDPDSRMLRGFLDGVGAHLVAGGEAWLVLSDLAEHLGLRPRDALEAWITGAGLRVLGRHDIRPRHAKAGDMEDPLYLARSAEVTTLWRLGKIVG